MDYRTRTARWLLGASAHPGGRRLTEHLLDLLDLPARARVLDVACGAGATLAVLDRRGHAATGVDVQPGTRQAIVGDAHALPLTGDAFDAVLCECALSTFDRPDAALAEMARVLRPGGVVGMTDVLLARERASPQVVRAVDRLTTARTLAEYARLAELAGFMVVRTEDRGSDAAALVRRLRRRLPVSTTLRACAAAIRDGSLGYGLLVLEKG
ncbi:MAG: class I SAM-dependent methyltransferase [Actinobacteria bacterium]|nr:class I SAM-dependent methyltransferase [Actinomycetota bacterium]